MKIAYCIHGTPINETITLKNIQTHVQGHEHLDFFLQSTRSLCLPEDFQPHTLVVNHAIDDYTSVWWELYQQLNCLQGWPIPHGAIQNMLCLDSVVKQLLWQSSAHKSSTARLEHFQTPFRLAPDTNRPDCFPVTLFTHTLANNRRWHSCCACAAVELRRNLLIEITNIKKKLVLFSFKTLKIDKREIIKQIIILMYRSYYANCINIFIYFELN